ncbi:hypothetical protein Tco_0362952 [Tanacetum coccineum]
MITSESHTSGMGKEVRGLLDYPSYLDHSPLRYALTHDPPVVFDSLVKQFWATATVRPNAAGSHDLVATIDGREVVVTESLIRAQLQLDDANGSLTCTLIVFWRGIGRLLVSPEVQNWEERPIPLTPPMLAIAAAGNDAADEENVLAHAVAGSPAEAHPVPHPPPFSPVREHTTERGCLRPNGGEYPTPEPASPPIPPAQTLRTRYLGPLPRPANYIAPEDIDNLNSMEDDTIFGGFHEETHAGPDDAPTTTADAAGRAEDPALLTSLSARLTCVYGTDLDYIGKLSWEPQRKSWGAQF